MEKDKATLPDTEQLKTKVSEIIWEEFEAHLKEGEYFNGNDLGEKITELFAKEVIELREKNKLLSNICQTTHFVFDNEANYPYGTIGYNIAKEIEAALNPTT